MSLSITIDPNNITRPIVSSRCPYILYNKWWDYRVRWWSHRLPIISGVVPRTYIHHNGKGLQEEISEMHAWLCYTNESKLNRQPLPWLYRPLLNRRLPILGDKGCLFENTGTLYETYRSDEFWYCEIKRVHLLPDWRIYLQCSIDMSSSTWSQSEYVWDINKLLPA